MVTSPTKAKKRVYRSSLREKQTAATREVILDAVGRLLSDPTRSDFTMAQVAKEAAVAPATVFRHFENRQALFDAFVERGAGRFRLAPNLADELDELPTFAPRLFAYYEEHGDLLRAAMRTPWMEELNRPARARRGRRFRSLVRKRYEHLDDAACTRVAAELQLLLSVQSWVWYVDAFSMSTQQAAEITAASIVRLIQQLDRQGEAS